MGNKKIIIEKKETREENINKKKEWYKSLVPMDLKSWTKRKQEKHNNNTP